MKRTIVLLLALAALASGAVACGVGRTPTPTPLPLQAPGWEEVTVRTLCLEVEQSFPHIGGKGPEPIAETAQRILARIGVQVVTEGAPCDATLTVVLTGRALGANYIGTGYCFTGAEVSGQVAFTVPDREPLTTSVEGRVPTPDVVLSCPQEPGAARFDRAWPEALLDGLTYLWGPRVLVQALGAEIGAVAGDAANALGEMGPEVVEAVPALIEALRDEDGGVRRHAVGALGDIGRKAREAVPALIQVVEDEDEFVDVRYGATTALKKITGQDFGNDAAAWRQWWEEQE